MEPCNFSESNKVLGPPEGMTEDQVHSIFAYIGHMPSGAPVIITCWKPNMKELEALKDGGKLWLYVLGHTQPPVMLTTENPWG